MKTKSSLESAFFNPRALVGFGFSAIGLLLALVAFFALPKHSAWATPDPCTNVAFTQQSGGIPLAIYVVMESHNQGYPNSPCTIYYTISSGTPPTPNHGSRIYTDPLPVLYGETKFFKAFGHATGADPEDSAITSYMVSNDPD